MNHRRFDAERRENDERKVVISRYIYAGTGRSGMFAERAIQRAIGINILALHRRGEGARVGTDRHIKITVFRVRHRFKPGVPQEVPDHYIFCLVFDGWDTGLVHFIVGITVAPEDGLAIGVVIGACGGIPDAKARGIFDD